MKRLMFIFLIMVGFNAFAEDQLCANSSDLSAAELGIKCSGSHYNWAKSVNGWGYCYQWTCNGLVLNQGRPVSNYLCESSHPSHYSWAKSVNGWAYCYQYTPANVAMNDGKPASNYLCESSHPSYYRWARSVNGHTYCYQYAPIGVAMNDGKPVSNYLCQ